MPHRRYPQKHLIDILKSPSGHSKFVLFIGAGASQCSGVELASDMIRDWREDLFEQSGATGDQNTFLRKFPWYDTDDEYSNLFELVYDEPSQRREYIEDCLKDASPSWGYIYLVNLLRKRVFNTVFTTNFDDLLNEACYLYSTEVRPIVCAHDSSIRTIRMTSDRPKIIKLHGDFLFDNIKNTVSELETLEANMRHKFTQYASEFGLIVIGYHGADRSVMDTLSLLLRNEALFQYGVYWCFRKGSKLSQKAEALLQYRRFRCVEIDGFDEFTAALHAKLGHDLQPELADPYGSLAKRLNDLTRKVSPGLQTDPIIERDIRDIGRKITSPPAADAKFELTADVPRVTVDIGSSKIQLQLPFGFLARIKENEGNTREALDFVKRQLKQGPNLDDFQYGVRLAIKTSDEKALEDLIAQISTLAKPLNHNYRRVNDVVLDLINAEKYAFAASLLDILQSWYAESEGPTKDPEFQIIFDLNRIQIKRHQNEPLTSEEVAKLQKYKVNSSDLIRFGAFILLQDYPAAEQAVKEVQAKNPALLNQIKNWPITRLLRPHLTDSTLKDTLKLSGLPKGQKIEKD